MVASQRKGLTLLRQLEQEGVEVEALLPRLFVPIGLATGGRSPAGIAVSKNWGQSTLFTISGENVL